MLMMFALRFIRMGGTAIPDLGEILKELQLMLMMLALRFAKCITWSSCCA